MLNRIISTGEVEENSTTAAPSVKIALKAVNHPEGGVSGAPTREVGKVGGR